VPEMTPADLERVRREVVVRVSLGDLHLLWQTVAAAIRWRDPSILGTSWWLWREHGRRGTWEPFTLGDYVVLMRMRRWVRSVPRKGVRPWWRHGRAERADA
jgi:hypothetical protein